MPEISVIVPVYKVEKYINECLDSILAQTFLDYELILIDDGSPDNCGKTCDEYAKKDARIVVIHQKNRGLSASRNIGLEKASGRFVTFIDSDDLVSPLYLECLYEGLTENNSEISCCRYNTFDEHNKMVFEEGNDSNTVKTGRDLVIQIYKNNTIIPVAVWGKLYKKELFSGFKFPVGKIAEDNYINPIVIYKTERCTVINNRLYGYRIRKESIMTSAFSIRNYDCIDAFNNCIEYFNAKKDKELVEIVNTIRVTTMYNYSFLAKKSGFYSLLPRKYKIGELEAMNYMRKHLSYHMYTYQVAKHHPKLIIILEYLKKLQTFIGT